MLWMKSLKVDYKNCLPPFPWRTWVWAQDHELRSRHSTIWATLPVYFAVGYLEDVVLWTCCLGWAQTWIFPVSGSQVAGMTGVSHQLPARAQFCRWERAVQGWAQDLYFLDILLHHLSHAASPQFLISVFSCYR
jgi:hypothetical protein